MTRSRQNPVSRLLLGCTLLSVAATLYVTRWGFSLPDTATEKHSWPRNFTSLRSEKQILIFKRRS